MQNIGVFQSYPNYNMLYFFPGNYGNNVFLHQFNTSVVSKNQKKKEQLGETRVEKTSRSNCDGVVDVESEKMCEKDFSYEKEKDRNMISNSMKVFRKFLVDSAKFKASPISKIISQKKLKYSVEEFLYELQQLIPKNRNYLGAKFILSLTAKKRQETNFDIVLRILFNYYYKNMIFPTVLTSIKILKNAKRKQLASARKINQFTMN